MKKSTLPVATLLTVIAASPIWAESHSDAVPVTVVALGQIAVPVVRDVEAKLISLNDTPVSSELSARVIGIHAEVGETVSQGAVLAQLDCRDYEVALRQAQAGAATVQARIDSTAARTDAAGSRYDAAAARARAATSRVDAANARVKAAQSQVAAANARAQASAARIKSVTANMQSVGTRINTAKSQVNTAKSQAAAAGARIPAAQAQLKLAQAQWQRNQQLRDKKLVPVEAFDQARASFDSAQSSLRAVQAESGAAQAGVSTALAGVSEAEGAFRAAQAEVEAAKADLASTKADVSTQSANTEISMAEVDTTKADVLSAQADADTAKAEWEAAKADLVMAKTELASAQAQIDGAEVVVERCQITAPFSGQVTARMLQLGQLAAPGAPAFQLLQTNGLEISARLSADEIRDQEAGDNVNFSLNGQLVAVTRRSVVGQVDAATGTQEVRFSLNETADLPVGSTGRLSWQGKYPAIPSDWLMRREGGLGLMLAKDGKAEFYPLRNAREGQPTLTELPPDTLLINDNRLRVRHGQAIDRVDP